MKLTGRWFPQIVQWESISNIYITKIVVLVSEPVRGRSRPTKLPCSTTVMSGHLSDKDHFPLFQRLFFNNIYPTNMSICLITLFGFIRPLLVG